jgi:hypothetical protein
VSAPAELVIEVTADDIRLGEKRSLCLCPIARAIARLRGTAPVNADGESTVIVSTVSADIPDENGIWVSYCMPVAAAAFIAAFDSARQVEPFTFTARLVTP